MDADGPDPGLSGEGARRLAAGTMRIIVVGAGGWLGLATVELLHTLLGEAFVERVVCFGSQTRRLNLRDGLTVTQRPLADLKGLAPHPSLVLHFAFLTQEKAKSMSPGAYVAANQAISRAVLEALDPIGATGVFVASSGAVYLVDQPQAEASKRLYGRLKLEDEAAFADWAESPGRRAVIARVFNVSGPYINKTSSYALSCFIADVLAGRPIVIDADRPVLRSYVAIRELMSVVLGALTDGETGTVVFDTVGEAVHEMASLAADVAQALERRNGVTAPADRTGAEDRYVGDSAYYRAFLSQYGVEPVAFARQVRETARFMASGGLGLDVA